MATNANNYLNEVQLLRQQEAGLKGQTLYPTTTNEISKPGGFFDMLPIYLGLVLVISIVLILVLREVFTWYWKINRIVGLLEEISYNTTPKESLPSNLDKANIKK